MKEKDLHSGRMVTTMKVKDLIEKLKTYDEDSIIELECIFYGHKVAGGDATDISESDGRVTICCEAC